MEMMLAVVRGVVLIGAVCFAFGLLFFGFHVVVREYNMLRTRKQIDEFLRMTNESGLQADIAKGTLSLNRTRPGILLIGIGAVLLIVCALQPFQYESTSQQQPVGGVRLPTRVEREAIKDTPTSTPAPAPSATPATAASPVAAAADARGVPVVFAYPPPVPTARPAPQRAAVGPGGQAGGAGPPAKLTFEAVEALRLETLDKWMGEVDRIKGKKLGEQMEILRARFGEAAVGLDSFMLEKPSSVAEMTKIAYGDARYAPLLRASNPQLPAGDEPVPAYRTVYFLQPLLAAAQPSTSMNRTLLRITAGEGKVQLYELLLANAEQVMQSDEYRRDPSGWWQSRGGVPEFERGLTKSTGRKWAFKFYDPEPNETPETVAKIFYGAAKYAPLLAFFNHDKPELFADPKAAFPAGTKLIIVFLSEA